MEKRKTKVVDEIVKDKKSPTFAAVFEKTLKAASLRKIDIRNKNNSYTPRVRQKYFSFIFISYFKKL